MSNSIVFAFFLQAYSSVTSVRGVYDLTEEQYAVVEEPTENSNLASEELYASKAGTSKNIETANKADSAALGINQKETREGSIDARRQRQRTRTISPTYSGDSDIKERNESINWSDDDSASWSGSEEDQESNREQSTRHTTSKLQRRRQLNNRPTKTSASLSEVRWKYSGLDDEQDIEIDEDLALMQRRENRRRARVARRQSLGLGPLPPLQSSIEVPGGSWKRSNYNSRNVPWYVRPIVLLFPFLKDWGGFM